MMTNAKKLAGLSALAAAGAGALVVSRMKPSTRAYIRSVGWHRPDLWLHGLFYFGHTLQYIRIGRWATGFAHRIPGHVRRHYAETYHGKLVPLEEAQKLVTVSEEIELRDLEKVIPFSMCRDIVLENPDAILACKCVCRMTSPNHCQPDEVCLVIGEPYVSYILDHQPEFCRRVTAEEAVKILRQTDEAGCLHAAFFKNVTRGRFYAICNCCPCCCVALKSHRFHGVPFYGHSGLEPSFSDACNGCRKCVEACLFEALTPGGKRRPPVLDREACMGCGACRAACPQGAVTLVEATSRPAPLRLDELLERRH
ncbi:MAG: 4Fe-4S binding protein [Actinobacteria bacterium]|nr:4Fe-4S binding protein [Actinomycetota bacterium]